MFISVDDNDWTQSPLGKSGSNLSRRTMIGYAASASALGLIMASRDQTPALATTSGTVGIQALGDPVGWDGHSNGNVPLSAMPVAVSVGGGSGAPFQYPHALDRIYMRPDAAADLTRWMAAYNAKFNSWLKLNEGYRTLAGQQYWFDEAQKGGNEAAPVGRSNHGLGQAIDFERAFIPEGSSQLTWLRQTCGDHGFAVYANERWHFDYIRPWNPGATPPTADNNKLLKELDMRAFRVTQSAAGKWDAGDKFLVGLGESRQVSQATLDGMLFTDSMIVPKSSAAFAAILDDLRIPHNAVDNYSRTGN
jgi:hypothetical protein